MACLFSAHPSNEELLNLSRSLLLHEESREEFTFWFENTDPGFRENFGNSLAEASFSEIQILKNQSAKIRKLNLI